MKTKSRKILMKKKFEKGLFPLSRSLKRYKINQKVVITPVKEEVHLSPDVHFCGKVGTVKQVYSKTYLVLVNNKKIITSAVHLKNHL